MTKFGVPTPFLARESPIAELEMSVAMHEGRCSLEGRHVQPKGRYMQALSEVGVLTNLNPLHARCIELSGKADCIKKWLISGRFMPFLSIYGRCSDNMLS